MPKDTRKPKRTTSGISNLVRRRHINVYDAVAGRVTTNGFLPDHPVVSKERDTVSSTHIPLPPDQVLFKKKRAPTRYEEADIYHADRGLGTGSVDGEGEGGLPDPDLVRALHAYCSDFYAAAYGEEGSRRDWRSLDETALLAMGMLMEEQAKEMVGETGDLVFVEAEEDEEGDAEEVDDGAVSVRSAAAAPGAESGRVRRAASAMSMGSMGSHADRQSYLEDRNIEIVPASGSEVSDGYAESQRSARDSGESE